MTGPKGFKGKGAGMLRQRLRALDAELDRVHAEMADLVRQTREMPNRTFALQIYRRTDPHGVRVWMLRWRFDRLRVEFQAQHATWSAIEPHLANLALAIAEWYRQINSKTKAANEHEKRIRAEARAIRAELEEP